MTRRRAAAALVTSLALIVTNDQATYLIRPPRGLPLGDVQDLIELGRRGAFTELCIATADERLRANAALLGLPAAAAPG